MITVNYYLKGAISETKLKELQRSKDPLLQQSLNKPRQVYLTVSGLGKRIQIYTKRRVAQNEWKKDQQLVDCRKNKINGTEINDWLTMYKQAVTKQNSTNENIGKTTTIVDLRKIMDTITPTGAKKGAYSFQEYFDKFIREHKTGDGFSKKTRTIQKYNTFNNLLKEFTDKKRRRLQIEAFDLQFLLDFKDYLHNERNLGDNTVAKYIKTAKTFVRFYINAGIIQTFNFTDVKSNEKEGEIYIITLKQLMQLQNYELADKRLDESRDVFCFQCWTGQRSFDIEHIKRQDIKVNDKGEKVWDLHTEKTSDNIQVPILEYAETILEKYKHLETPIPKISNQDQNVLLKELGELVSSDDKDQKKIDGFGSDTKIVEFLKGRRKESFVPFYKVLTTHVARKSYITNSLILGVPERVVKQVSGHKSEKDFRRYVKLADSYKDEIIRKSYSMENISKFI